MDKENIRAMKRICPPEKVHKISLLMDYAENCPGVSEVPDPYTGDIEGFHRVYDIIARASDGFLKYILDRHDL